MQTPLRKFTYLTAFLILCGVLGACADARLILTRGALGSYVTEPDDVLHLQVRIRTGDIRFYSTSGLDALFVQRPIVFYPARSGTRTYLGVLTVPVLSDEDGEPPVNRIGIRDNTPGTVVDVDPQFNWVDVDIGNDLVLRFTEAGPTGRFMLDQEEISIEGFTYKGSFDRGREGFLVFGPPLSLGRY